MFSLAYLRPTLALAAVLLGPACSVVNTDHCGNREGNATCQQRDPATPYCSICVADNNGCLAEDPGDSCLAETAPPIVGDSNSSTGSSTSSPTTVDPVTSSTTVEPPTSTTVSTGPVDPTTTTDPTTGTSTTSTDATTTTGETTTSTGSDTDTSTGDTGTSSGSESSGSSESSGTGGPVCGNNEIEGDEVCDGTDLDGKKCATLLPDKWGGGTLACNNCSSFNDKGCCIGVGQKCKILAPDGFCCPGLTCKADMLLGNACKN